MSVVEPSLVSLAEFDDDDRLDQRHVTDQQRHVTGYHDTSTDVRFSITLLTRRISHKRTRACLVITGGRFDQILDLFSGFENGSSQWLSRRNLSF